MKRKYETRVTSHKLRAKPGSALILAVVLTSLLAIVGVMFVMVARVDKMSTSAIAENKQLNLAVDTAIARISQELVLDVPGMRYQEYYDYPDPCNPWLANLEPYQFAANDYRWRQISNITGSSVAFLNWPAVPIPDYQSDVDVNDYYPADADGDGVSDSMWVRLDNITSSKGEPIYAAIRVVDNGAMLNVNTGYKFDPSDPGLGGTNVDGSSQMQINLMGLSWRPGDVYDVNDETELLNERTNYPVSGIDPNDLDGYKENVVWRYNEPSGAYTPFDISDELEIRNRFLLNHPDIDTRLEAWGGEFRNNTISTPVDSGGIELDNWFKRANSNSLLDPCDPNYAYRHIATTYNMDRIINPVGGKMANINRPANAEELYYALLASIDPNINPDMDIDIWSRSQIKNRFAQLTANVVDFTDDDTEVTVFEPNDPDIWPVYYGFDAQPFITEIGFIISDRPESGDNYYAVELYNPFDSPIPLEDFELVLIDSNDTLSTITIEFDLGDIIPANGCFVIANDLAQFVIDVNNTNTKEGPYLTFFGPWLPPVSITPPTPPGPPGITPPDAPKGTWSNNYELFLRRRVGDPTDPNWIYVDRQLIIPSWAGPGQERYFGRDTRDWRVVYQIHPLIEDTVNPSGTLGRANIIESTGFPFSFFLPNPLTPIQGFVTVGDIPRILTIGHGIEPSSTIGEKLFWTSEDEEDLVRLDLQDPNHRNIFQYLTVFDPTSDGIDNDGDGLGVGAVDPNELKIPGRININTAPWYVIAQLPWVSAHTPNYELAQAIIAYRDKLDLSSSIPSGPDYYHAGAANSRELETGIPDVRENFGFASIGELATVINNAGAVDYDMRYYALDFNDLESFPDLTPSDGITNDFEERDVIFSRISNLVTVRSDVFTAYILVRIGADGPQKRAIAILDRSDVYPIDEYPFTVGRVKVRAIHSVPDPR